MPGLAGRVERVRLARARFADHDLDVGAGGGEPPHHRLLLGRQGPASQRALQLSRLRDGDLVELAIECEVDGSLLGQQQALGGVAAFASIGGYEPAISAPDDVDDGEVAAGGAEGDEQVSVVLEDRVGSPFEVGDRRAGRQASRHLLQHVAAGECRRRLGEPLVDDQLLPQRPDVWLAPAGATEQPFVPAGTDAGCRGTAGPRVAEFSFGRMPALGLARGERRGLRRGRRYFAPVGHVGDDGCAAAGEGLDQLPVDAPDVGMAVDDRLPGDAEPAGELLAEVGLVEDAGSLGVREQLPRVERAPDPVVAGAGEVGDQHVGVQQRIVRPRGAVPERRRDESVHLDGLGPARTAAGEPGGTLHVTHRGVHGGVVRGNHLLGRRLVAQSPQQRHRFRRPEGVVEAGHLPRRVRGQPLPRVGMSGVEHRPQLLGGDLARQAERLALSPSHRPGSSPRAR